MVSFLQSAEDTHPRVHYLREGDQWTLEYRDGQLHYLEALLWCPGLGLRLNDKTGYPLSVFHPVGTLPRSISRYYRRCSQLFTGWVYQR